MKTGSYHLLYRLRVSQLPPEDSKGNTPVRNEPWELPRTGPSKHKWQIMPQIEAFIG